VRQGIGVKRWSRRTLLVVAVLGVCLLIGLMPVPRPATGVATGVLVGLFSGDLLAIWRGRPTRWTGRRH